MTDKSMLTDNAKKTVKRTLNILIETSLYNIPEDESYLPTSDGEDTILDIITAAILLDSLHIHNVIVPVLYEGTGTICVNQKILPVPLPDVAEIVEKHHLNLHITEQEGKFITRAGAALCAAICTSKKLPEQFGIEKTGVSGLLRGMLIQDTSDERDESDESHENKSDQIWKLECNLDDCRGEALGFTMNALFNAGARDVYYTPIFMKKNRPAYQLNVICSVSDKDQMEEIIFTNTTTIGIRRIKMDRSILNRKPVVRKTDLGEIRYKVCTFANQNHVYPEYESIASLCEHTQMSYEDAYHYAVSNYEPAKSSSKDPGQTHLQ